MALASQRRIKSNREIGLVFRKGRGAKSELLAIRATKNNLAWSRFAILVSKKVSPKAVARNRIKRILSETIRIKQGEIKKGYDIIINVLMARDKAQEGRLKEDLLKLLTKLSLYEKGGR